MVKVAFSTGGCFHHNKYDFEFRRNPALAAKVTRIGETFNLTPGRPVTARRIPLGSVALSEHEAAGLDGLMDSYRALFPVAVDRISRKSAILQLPIFLPPTFLPFLRSKPL